MIQIRHEAFKYYFYFMQERMNIFWNKYNGDYSPWTNDEILFSHKFTNVYRSADRVSQYLIRNVIYTNENYLDDDIIFRILIFKVFNRIETWEYLESQLGNIKIKNFNIEKISNLLSARIKKTPIFSPAYLMTGSHKEYLSFNSKHERWLRMIDHMFIKERRFTKILNAKGLNEIFIILKECPFIGDFLAYQYSIDFNYSNVINFDENSFVKAGVGAIRGIHKCFINLGNYSYEDAIKYTQEYLEYYREFYGYNDFNTLFGRQPTLIDLQNCFCETDKYLRVKLPELKVGNVRIKQKYKKPLPAIDFFFPPKWNINHEVSHYGNNI